MSKIKYPDKLEIKFSGFVWTIKFLDVIGESHGLTFPDDKIVQIFTKNKTDQNILETLTHELEHVVLFDLSQAIFGYDVENLGAKEENLVRLTSPRVFSIVRDNLDFMDWYIKAIKKLEA